MVMGGERAQKDARRANVLPGYSVRRKLTRRQDCDLSGPEMGMEWPVRRAKRNRN